MHIHLGTGTVGIGTSHPPASFERDKTRRDETRERGTSQSVKLAEDFSRRLFWVTSSQSPRLFSTDLCILVCILELN